jgi:hypothetical protein
MSKVQTKLALAVLIGSASFFVMVAPDGAARADCITEPRTETPQGKHWYYHIERGTGRHCWYVRGEDEASPRAPTTEAAAASKPAPQTTAGSAPARSLADAHAELAPRARADGGDAQQPQSVWPGPPAAPVTTGIGPGAGAPVTSTDSPLASRWPKAAGAPATAGAAPDPSAVIANAQADESAVATPPPAAPPSLGAPLIREVGSLQKLVLVAFGALALAGISGSLVYRLAGARRRKQRQQRWPERQPSVALLAEPNGGAPWVAPDLSPTVPHVDAAAEEIQSGDSVESRNDDDGFEKIEDFLARLTRQFEDEIQGTRPTELEQPHQH